jgi:hypothetical protein
MHWAKASSEGLDDPPGFDERPELLDDGLLPQAATARTKADVARIGIGFMPAFLRAGV